MLKKVRHFFKHYRLLGFVLITMIIGLILDLTGRDLAAHVVLAVGALVAVFPLLRDMIHTLRSGEYGIDILAITAIVTAVVLHEYWAAIIVALMLTGGAALEDYAEARAKGALSTLLKKKPKLAHLLKGGKTVDIPARDVKVGDKIVILPGEVVPVDCVITEGSSSFDESSLTGESLPVDKHEGDQLLSGSINNEGAVTCKAIREAANSQYEQIIKLVRSASASKSPFVRLADRVSIPFTALSFLIAGAAWFVTKDPERFLEVLVVATPCPLLLGAPIALISGMGRAAKHGIIVKTGSALERLAEVQTMAFDKTGTLTTGQPVVQEVLAFNKHTKNEVLQYAAALETSSTHVLAAAIVEAATQKKIKIPKAKQVNEISGHGVSGRLQGKSITVGRLNIESTDIKLPAAFKKNSIKQTAAYVMVDNELIGIITFADELRSEAKSLFATLKKLGIKHTLMVTGDNEPAAKAIAKKLGIEEVRANCLPSDKILALEKVQYRPVAFVGDGVNDAPVLTAADVGIALGARGSTAASESADVVILLDDISKVGTAVSIAKRTFSIASQSIYIGIFLSIGLMAIFATGRFSAVQGALVQEVVDIVVILNALRAHGR
ncbi:MAG: cadA [Candidatus Saccharibacteria bacterium]|nr:cadA [Candidatus Saccharibacteria bacterium]